MSSRSSGAIQELTSELYERIQRNPLLNMETFAVPSAHIADPSVELSYEHSFVWMEEGELLGFILVYGNPDLTSFHIFKLVTSPFVRGRGIGTALLEHYASSVPSEALIYLYVWERQADTLEFFLAKGFELGHTTVYKNLVYYRLDAEAQVVAQGALRELESGIASDEAIGKTRHDARKTIRLLSNMVDMLSLENCGRIIEDINRETTSLINTLNSFRDTASRMHEVNITQLILERIIPYVEASSIPCELRLVLKKPNALVLGNYVSYSRALINLVSNALDAIGEANRHGCLEIEIADTEKYVTVTVSDNGIGIDPEQLTITGNGLPRFVGQTTKEHRAGEGFGTVQIYSTFGPENIEVSSRRSVGSEWKVRIRKPASDVDRWLLRLEGRYNEVCESNEAAALPPKAGRSEVISYIWMTRKMEIFLFDLILQFSMHNNIRSIYRTILSYLMHDITEEGLRSAVAEVRANRRELKRWLLDATLLLRERWDTISTLLERMDIRGAMLKSYGQAIENVIIFTLNPATGIFLATDRKLAEHLDFAPYLGAPRDCLLRGEFIGDINNDNQPIYLGVWSIDSEEDLLSKLRLLRAGAAKLVEIGVHGRKRLSFYPTTHPRHQRDIDSDASTRFDTFAALSDDELLKFVRDVDQDFQDFMIVQD